MPYMNGPTPGPDSHQPHIPELTVRRQEDRIELQASGEWDLLKRDAVRRAIAAALEPHPDHVMLDLGQLSFIDSTGIHTVLHLLDHCRCEQIELQIVCGSSAIRRLFEICGLAEALPFKRTGP